METRQEQESALDSLVDDITTKIWVENLKPQDRLAFASTSKKYLSFFKSQATVAYVHDLLTQLRRVGITGFTSQHFTGVSTEVITKLTHAFAEDFRSGSDKEEYLRWLQNELLDKSDASPNPYIGQLMLIKLLFDLELKERPSRLYQPCFLGELPALLRFIQFFLIKDAHLEWILPITQEMCVQIHEDARLPVLQEVRASIKERGKAIHNVRNIKLPDDFHLASTIKNPNMISDHLAAFISQTLMQCSEKQLKFINEFIIKECSRGVESSILVVKLARYLEIGFSLEKILDGASLECWVHFHFFKKHISALKRQSIASTTFPLIQKLKSEYTELDDVIFLAAIVYCLHAKRFSHLNHTIKQFICAMSALKEEHERLYVYIRHRFQLQFREDVEISSSALEIEQLTPYLIKGTAQRVLEKHFDSLPKLIQHGYLFPTAYSTFSILLQSLEKLDSTLLTEDDLEKLIVYIPQCRTADRVVKEFEADRCRVPRVSM